jgi:hypothetical protein
MLAGLTVVGAAQDAIDGFALTAGGRILDLTMQTLGVVIGILVGSNSAASSGSRWTSPTIPRRSGPSSSQFAGAIIIAVAVAVFNGAGIRIILVSALLSAVTIAGLLDVDRPEPAPCGRERRSALCSRASSAC